MKTIIVALVCAAILPGLIAVGVSFFSIPAANGLIEKYAPRISQEYSEYGTMHTFGFGRWEVSFGPRILRKTLVSTVVALSGMILYLVGLFLFVRDLQH